MISDIMTRVITRFAPSPTGYLHIGSARTALFNWLFAKHHGGQFLLRIEDTDRERSTKDAVDAIFQSLSWLGLEHDGDVVFQSARAPRHQEVAHQLLLEGKAYYCYCSPEELDHMREEARQKGLPVKYNGLWRERDPKDAPKDRPPVVRLKAPLVGETIIHDQVQGDVRVDHGQLDDMVLLRSDGTPTYMLSVVVDDHDMGITHVIRGDDHLTNTFRQKILYDACGWEVPLFSHIPLIHGPDGAKLSKRHGALGAEQYKAMGVLPEAMCNYLLRLGWGHGNEEIIPRDKAIALFDLDGVGKAPSRFDMVKLTSLNAHYMRDLDPKECVEELMPFLSEIGHSVNDLEKDRLKKAMHGLTQRAKTLVELAQMSMPYLILQDMDEKGKILWDKGLFEHLLKVIEYLLPWDDFSEKGLEDAFRLWAHESSLKMGDLAQVTRIALTGRTISPSIFEMMMILGKDETLKRLKARL